MVPPQVLAVHFHGINLDRGFMLSEKPITGRASYRIKAKNMAILCTRFLDRAIVTKIENFKSSSLTIICVLNYCKCLSLHRGKASSTKETEPFKQFKASYGKPSYGCRLRYLFCFSPQSLFSCFRDICW